MRAPSVVLIALVLAALPIAGQAGTPYEAKAKCAVGGGAFTYISTASYSTFGSRPDGKPYGSWSFPLELPVCPGNGLVMYREFTPAEVDRLRDLIATPAYLALRNTDTAYYRAAWLERALKPGTDNAAAWLLLQASWEADPTPALRARYLREFAEAAAATKGPPSLQQASIQLRIANAWRELGDFAKARAVVEAISYDIPPPADDPDFAGNLAGTKTFAEKLLVVIDRKDASSEPLDMLPPMVAAQVCLDGPAEARASSKRFCEAEPLASQVARMRKARGDLDKD